MVGFAYGVVLSFIVVALSIRFGWLTIPAAIGAFILGVLVFGFCGIQWSVPLLVFFFSSVLLTRMAHGKKREARETGNTEPRRHLYQVLANGGLAGVVLLIDILAPDPRWYLLYGAVIASVTSDTWSTEVGILSSKEPRSIRDGKKVPVGSSGGLTVPGLAAGLAGSACIYLSMVPWLGFDFRSLCVVGISGFIANLGDSLLGATLQVRYRCPSCGMITERQHHCNGIPTEYHRGIRLLTNDGVNFIASVCGAATATILAVLFRI